MTRYFLVTGLDEGINITPYMIKTDGTTPYWLDEVYGDKCRYYENIEFPQVADYLAQGMDLEYDM